METIQVVLDSDLLRAADGAAKRARVNRSVLVRRALREHLKRLRTESLEARDRRAHQQHPDDPADAAYWEKAATWPES